MSQSTRSIQSQFLNSRASTPSELRVPKENIIDLRTTEIHKEDAPRHVKKEHVLFRRLRSITLPKISFLAFTRGLTTRTSEKVIVSHSRIRPHHGHPAVNELSAELPPPEKIQFGVTDTASHWRRSLISFSVLCLVIVIPVYLLSFYHQADAAKGEVLGISEQAYQNLKDAGQATSQSDYLSAGQSFSQAASHFDQARQQLSDAGGVVVDASRLIPNKIASADALLSAGQNLSKAGQSIASLVNGMSERNLNPLGSESISLSDFLLNIRDNLRPVNSEISEAITQLEKVRIKDIPSDMQSQVQSLKDSLPLVQQQMSYFFSVSDVLLQMLGADAPKRYLLIFQNSRELRPTGGFMGSIALMDIEKGKIKNLEVPGGGVYDVAGQLKEKIISPKPLWLVNPLWNIQDSNWFIDFPTSASKIMWFYERTGGATVDGIITLTPQVIEKLLDVTGPIDMQADYGVYVTGANFSREAQLWAEVTYDREENKPKKFISDLLPKLLSQVFETKPENLLKIVSAFNQSLSEKDILIYFADEHLESQVAELDWAGQLKSTDKDFLSVVSANIAGGKTDQVVNQYVTHRARIQSDGTIVDTVTITRAHFGNPLDQWEGKTNVDYIRLYVPLGSKLISAEGFSTIENSRYILPDQHAEPDADLQRVEQNAIIDEKSNTRITAEFNKTTFGNWLSVDPGSSITASITYSLPWKLQLGGLFGKSDQYSLYIQKQPGMVNNFFTSQVALPEKFDVLWKSSELKAENGQYEFNSDMHTDKIIGLLVKN